MTLSVVLAQNAGFCFGVDRAVQTVFRLLDEGKKVATLGPVIHNPQVTARMAERGVVIVRDPAETPEGYVLVIRSHGVPPDVRAEAEKLEIPCEDATCPYVAKIHKIVERAAAAGRAVLIAGDRNHPEVRGILGRAGADAHVFSDPGELADLLQNRPDLKEIPVTAVAQTTFSAKMWNECQNSIKKLCTKSEIFDTICNATAIRQAEAEALAMNSDLMVVIGGRESSNTAKLRDVCAAHTRAVLIETAAELPRELVLRSAKIGVTAGASTPDGIIKEVLMVMSEIKGQAVENQAAEVEANATDVSAQANGEVAVPEDSAANVSVQNAEPAETPAEEESFEELLEDSLKNLNSDQRVTGVVVAVTPSEIQVDIGRKHAGFIPLSEYSNDPNAKPEEELKPGDQIDVIVVRVNDAEGTVLLSKRRLDAVLGWEKIVAAKESDEVLEGTVSKVIKGGVIAVVNGVNVFVPASHATANRGEPLEDLVGKKVRLRIIEINRGRRAVGSVRSVLRDERKAAAEAFWQNVKPGDKYTGKVKSLTSYGAFVDLGGVDGMIHISELSWQRIKNPAEVVAVGDTVDVYVKDVDFEKKKISLGYKTEDTNPWVILKKTHEVGDVVNVEIVSLTSYGAFARIIPGVDGLIHVSQIAEERVEKPADVLKVGQKVDAKIIDINYDAKRVSLSMKAVSKPEPEAEVADASENPIVAVSETPENE